MSIDPIGLTHSAVVLTTTYLLHSTILLSGVWLFVTLLRPNSPSLRERLWRGASLLPFATVLVQVMWIEARPVVAWTFTENASASTAARIRDTAGADPSKSVRVPSNFDAGNMAASDAAAATPPVLTESAVWNVEIVPASADDRPFVDDRPLRSHRLTILGAESVGGRRSSEENSRANRLGVRQAESTPRRSPLRSADIKSAGLSTVSANPATPRSEPIGTRAPPTTRRPVAARRDISTQTMVVWALLSSLLVWVTGAGLRMMLGMLALARRLRSANLLTTGAARHLVDELREQHDVRRRVRLLSSESCSEPAAFGVFHWTIMLPIGIEGRLEETQLRALLAHELAHFARGDTLWLWVGRLLSNCFAWQPLNLVAVRCWRQASEYLCDDWALQRGVSAITLAKCLTQIADWRINQQRVCTTGLAAGGTRHTLIARVERLMDSSRPDDRWQRGWRRVLFRCGVIVATASIIYAGPRTAWSVQVHEETVTTLETSTPNKFRHSEPMRTQPNAEAATDRSQGTRPFQTVDSASASHSNRAVPRHTARGGSQGARPFQTVDSASASHSNRAVPRQTARGGSARNLGADFEAAGDEALAAEFKALARDLDQAMRLLEQTEADDPEITTLVHRIRKRLGDVKRSY